MEDFLNEVIGLFKQPLSTGILSVLSRELQVQLKAALGQKRIAMLPSYHYRTPTGAEHGSYIVVDLGGSVLRIALVKLRGRSARDSPIGIAHLTSWELTDSVKALQGPAFFDWIASRIGGFYEQFMQEPVNRARTVSIGLAWSFPLEQTSAQSGNILAMGKGFDSCQGVEGQDLKYLIVEACRRASLNVTVEAVVNDAEAALLSTTYLDEWARVALILGTGVNAALQLPLAALASEKLGSRPESWHQKAKDVPVNTELSIFGGDVLPITRWDEQLKIAHPNPGMQPLEYLVGGRYLGEIVRLILVEGVREVGLLGGCLPETIMEPYSLETRIMGDIERDETATLDHARNIIKSLYLSDTSPRVTHKDVHFIREVCQSVSNRAAAYLATALHALCVLQKEITGTSSATDHAITIGCHGSVIQQYPRFRTTCESYLDRLLITDSGGRPGAVTLTSGADGTISGAAVAMALQER